MTLEKAGLPTVPLITDAFLGAAREMAELWGVPEFRYIAMKHPLAYLTPEEIDRRADVLLQSILELLKRGQPD